MEGKCICTASNLNRYYFISSFLFRAVWVARYTVVTLLSFQLVHLQCERLPVQRCEFANEEKQISRTVQLNYNKETDYGVLLCNEKSRYNVGIRDEREKTANVKIK